MTSELQYLSVDQWADHQGVLNKARTFRTAIGSPPEPHFAGSLAFLAQPEAQEVLDDWRLSSFIPSALADLSVATQTNAPPQAVPVSRGRSKEQYPEEFRAAPLAVMLCAQIPSPIRSRGNSLQDIACLRIYLLAKSMKEHQPWPELEDAARYVVRFLEETTMYPKAMEWIAQISGSNHHFDTYEAGIREGAKTLKAEIESNKVEHKPHTAGKKFADLMQAIVEGRRSTPEETTQEQVTFRISQEWSSALDEHLADKSVIQIEESVALPSEDNHEEDPTEIAILTEAPTPEHRFRLGLGLHLQTQTERNLLAYSWDRLRPDEFEGLSTLIDRWMQTNGLRLLGAIAFLALPMRTSVEVACSTVLSEIPKDSRWVLNIDSGKLLRTPNRPLQRLRIQKNAEGWVRALASTNELQLSPRVHAILLDALKERPNANTIGDLWTEEASPHAKFDRLCMETPGLQRITQGMLKATADQLVFNETNDAVFTRMLLSPTQSVKPSAGSYSSWTQVYTSTAFGRLSDNLLPPPNIPPSANALGSEIDPDDRRLKEAFAKASACLEDLLGAQRTASDTAWLDLHNAITVYSVVTLLACTGARPVTSIFECLQDFDLHPSRPRLFIDDKVIHDARSGRWGRITPLPPLAIELMQKLYLPYFDWLLDCVTTLGVHNLDFAELSVGMRAHKVDGTRPNMPLFFLLKRTPKLRIVEVSESEIKQSGCFDWPLPCNLFRHRLSTRLRSNGAGEDFAAAQLGHAEAGSEVYGSISPQCWADDENHWRHALEAAIRPLEISIVKFRIPPVSPSAVPSNFKSFLQIASFGSEARSNDRESTQQLAKSTALAMIQESVATALNETGMPALAVSQGSVPATLSEDQLRSLNDRDFWTALGRSMLFTEADTPRPNHATWFQTFEEFRTQRYQESYAPKLDRILVNRSRTQRFAFSQEALHAEQKLVELRKQIGCVFEAVPIYYRSLRLKGALSALDMALTSLVTDTSVLTGLSRCDPTGLQAHVRESILYLARTPSREEKQAPAFGWHCVPARSVQGVLDIVSSAGKQEKPKIPKELTTFTRNAEFTLGLEQESVQGIDRLIKKVCELVDHHNRLALPGIVASVRRGETASWSLDPYGLARAVFGKQVDALKVAPHSEAVLPVRFEVPDTNTYPIVKAHGSREAEEGLLKVVRKNLEEFAKVAKVAKVAKKNNWSDRKRLTAATKIERELHQARGTVSSSVQLLVSWILQMLRAKGAAGKMLRSSSIRTYISLLAPAFLDHGSEVNLLDADEDELEEFYFKVLTRPVDQAKRRQAHDSSGRRLDELSVLGRLREFHRFLEKFYGAESPDWSVLGEDLTSSQVSAQIITTLEYESALEILCPAGSNFDHNAYLEAFLLILGFRFGLRSGEAISMARHDWVSVKGGCVVLVSGTHKGLKSSAARRQIPLLGQLTSHETAVIGGWLDHWETLDLQSSAPLFPSSIASKVPTGLQVHRFRIATALRTVTGCDRVTFHHARHSFASLMFLRLMSPDLIPQLPGINAPWLWDAAEVQKQLLGRPGVTRRSPWALSVMLGHSHPRTTLVSYCHFVHEWANSRLIEMQKSAFLLPKAESFVPSWVPDLGLMAAHSKSAPSFPVLTRPKRNARTPQDVLHFLETLSRGMPPSRAGWLCSFDQTETNSLMSLLGHLTHDPAKIPVLNDDPVSEDSRLGQVIKGPTAQSWQELRDMFLNRALPPLDGLEAVYQIGGPLQILLWLDDHFDTLKGVMNSFGWEKEDLQLYVPPSGAHTSSALAKEYGWSPLTTYADAGGRKMHVDVARYPTLSKKPQIFRGGFVPMSETKDRVGVTVNLSHQASGRPRPMGV